MTEYYQMKWDVDGKMYDVRPGVVLQDKEGNYLTVLRTKPCSLASHPKTMQAVNVMDKNLHNSTRS